MPRGHDSASWAPTLDEAPYTLIFQYKNRPSHVANDPTACLRLEANPQGNHAADAAAFGDDLNGRRRVLRPGSVPYVVSGQQLIPLQVEF